MGRMNKVKYIEFSETTKRLETRSLLQSFLKTNDTFSSSERRYVMLFSHGNMVIVGSRRTRRFNCTLSEKQCERKEEVKDEVLF